VGSVIFLALILFVAWFFVIRPQQRRVRAHQAVVASLNVGDEVMTTSGILGTIKSMDGGEVLDLEVAPGIELRVVKGAIARRMGPEPSESDARQGDEDAGTGTEAAPAAEE
jgi:preprotein translocase subunit YajC